MKYGFWNSLWLQEMLWPDGIEFMYSHEMTDHDLNYVVYDINYVALCFPWVYLSALSKLALKLTVSLGIRFSCSGLDIIVLWHDIMYMLWTSRFFFLLFPSIFQKLINARALIIPSCRCSMIPRFLISNWCYITSLSPGFVGP